MAAILTELERESGRLAGEPLETVYYGGGTPSLLETETIASFQQSIRRHFELQPGAEITLEANPDDIDGAQLAGWREAGINRLSIGVQSFREEDLRWMNRAHSAAEALTAIEKARGAGFTDFNIDLIYGSPGLDDAAWEKNLETALSLGVNHISAYALTVEPRTALAHQVSAGEKEPTDPEQQARQFLLLSDWLEAAGWEHYEISNFALPGHRSRHNSAYWEGKPYLGLGPGAHSFDGRTRRWNVSNNALYARGIREGLPVQESETLTPENQFNEYVMTAIRRSEGINLEQVENRFGEKVMQELDAGAARFLAEGSLLRRQHHLALSREGKLFADGIAAALFR